MTTHSKTGFGHDGQCYRIPLDQCFQAQNALQGGAPCCAVSSCVR
jgi:hypothetical protein